MPADVAGVQFVADLQPEQTFMDKRTKILRQIAALDADTTVVDLRRQLSETHAAIDEGHRAVQELVALPR